MAQASDFKIDITETFPNLAAAPIVEAVIGFQASWERPWQRDELKAELTKRLGDYPTFNDVHQSIFEIAGTVGLTTTERQDRWQGFRLVSAEKRNVIRFTKDGMVFSRLQPYPGWEVFFSEAMRIWDIFFELAVPSRILRLNVRFVNLIVGAKHDDLGAFLRAPPSCPSSLPLASFLYQSTFDVPGHDLRVNVVKTLKLDSQKKHPDGLILDINVVSKHAFLCEKETWSAILPKMRSLKNRVFFDLLTPEAIDKLKGGQKCTE